MRGGFTVFLQLIYAYLCRLTGDADGIMKGKFTNGFGGKNMELRECYEAFGGDYNDAVGRLQSDALIRKFVVKFLDDPSYGQLKDAVEKGEYKEAFMAAHTLKDVSQNLSFKELGQVSSEITEALRDIEEKTISREQCLELLEKVEKAYEKTAGMIRKMCEEEK